MTSPIPDSHAGRRLAWLLSKVGGEPATDQELDENLSGSMRELLTVDRLQQMAKALETQFGKMTVTRVEETSPYELIAGIEGSQDGSSGRLPLAVETEPPHRITSATIAPAPKPAPGAKPMAWKELAERFKNPPGDSELEPQLSKAADERLDAAFAKGKFVGIGAGIVRDGRLVYYRPLGEADVEREVEITPSTTFRIGSVSKTFTATGVMQLLEKGKLGLDDKVNDRLKSYRIEGVDSETLPVTIRHLLTHTGGIQGRGESDIGVPRGNSTPSLNEFYSSGLKAKEPGKAWAYSNDGYSTLGQVVEDVSGMPFEVYMIENVFDPLGMTSTDYIQSERVGEVFTGYTLDFADVLPVPFIEVVVKPAGSVFSTIEEMAGFVEAICGQGANSKARILKDETFQDMITPQFKTGLPGLRMSMGFGFVLTDFGGHRVAWHNGGWYGASAEMWTAPDDGWGVLLFANSFAPGQTQILDNTAAALLRLVLGL